MTALALLRHALACLLVAAAGTGTARAAPAFENSMAQRTLACTACHGAQGRAGPDGYYPRLAGKPEGYLYNQLLNFREGRRDYALMTHLVDPLSDSYLMEMARYFSALDLPYTAPPRPAVAREVLRRGQALVMQGDAARRLPACVSCHGSAMTGVAPNVPGLLGLPRDYLNAQLGSWRAGKRRAHAPDCMAQVVKLMSDEDIHAAASWLAAQPVPAVSKPASAAPLLPGAAPSLSCGTAPPPAGAAR